MADSKKRKKHYCRAPQPKRKKPAWKEDLCPGMTGILITTNDQEKLCVPDAYNLLNEYADQLYGPESAHIEDSPGDNEGEDVATTLEQEVHRLRGSEQQPRRFQASSSGAKGTVFIQCRPPVEPVELVHHTLTDVMTKRQHKSRFCQRLIPVSVVCYATPEDIQKQVPRVLAPHFYQDNTLWKFAVVYKARNNTNVNRDDIIKTLASLATRNGDYAHTVDLRNPDLTIVVEIIKSNCCIGVVRDFTKLKRYNIHSIMETFNEGSQDVVGKTEGSMGGKYELQQENNLQESKNSDNVPSSVVDDKDGVVVSCTTGHSGCGNASAQAESDESTSGKESVALGKN